MPLHVPVLSCNSKAHVRTNVVNLVGNLIGKMITAGCQVFTPSAKELGCDKPSTIQISSAVCDSINATVVGK